MNSQKHTYLQVHVRSRSRPQSFPHTNVRTTSEMRVTRMPASSSCTARLLGTRLPTSATSGRFVPVCRKHCYYSTSDGTCHQDGARKHKTEGGEEGAQLSALACTLRTFASVSAPMAYAGVCVYSPAALVRKAECATARRTGWSWARQFTHTLVDTTHRHQRHVGLTLHAGTVDL